MGVGLGSSTYAVPITLRLGREDLYRPHRGLWVIQGPNAEMVFDHVGTPETDQAFGPYRLAYFVGEPQAEPLLQSIAWGNCRTNRRRSICRQKQGELRRGEVIFDGRFAHGYKLNSQNGKATLIIDPKTRARSSVESGTRIMVHGTVRRRSSWRSGKAVNCFFGTPISHKQVCAPFACNWTTKSPYNSSSQPLRQIVMRWHSVWAANDLPGLI